VDGTFKLLMKLCEKLLILDCYVAARVERERVEESDAAML
jgi:hypothetical protein